ncbi:MAG TPA: class I SAM-dependent methyltransferase [Pseudonocardiaceae bacterium]
MALRGNTLAHSFGTAATEYDRLRSGPPAVAVDWLVGDGITNAVELGAGTGKFSKMLAERIPELYPIEPDVRMRDVFAKSSPGLSALAGSAEEIPLQDASVDAVLAADAWHWFDPATACREITRVLRPGGLLAVSWTLRDKSVPWMAELFAVVNEYDHPNPPGVFALPENTAFAPPERRVFQWTRPMSPADLVALLGTYSVVLVMSEAERARLYDTSHEYIAKHPQLAGRELIDVPFQAVCWRTQLTHGNDAPDRGGAGPDQCHTIVQT